MSRKKSKSNCIRWAPQAERTEKTVALIKDVLAEGPMTYDELFSRLWPDPLREIYCATGEESMRLRFHEMLQNLAMKGDAHVVRNDDNVKVYTLHGWESAAPIEIGVGLGDVTVRARGKTYEKLTLDDFKLSCIDAARAHRIVFTDGKGYSKTLKDRAPGELDG